MGTYPGPIIGYKEKWVEDNRTYLFFKTQAMLWVLPLSRQGRQKPLLFFMIKEWWCLGRNPPLHQGSALRGQDRSLLFSFCSCHGLSGCPLGHRSVMRQAPSWSCVASAGTWPRWWSAVGQGSHSVPRACTHQLLITELSHALRLAGIGLDLMPLLHFPHCMVV
jgi:hypothetical protein